MGPLGKIASFFKNVPVEHNRKGNAVVYSSIGATCQRRAPGWSSLRLRRGFRGECLTVRLHYIHTVTYVTVDGVLDRILDLLTTLTQLLTTLSYSAIADFHIYT
jgi:hypothetical protein